MKCAHFDFCKNFAILTFLNFKPNLRTEMSVLWYNETERC